ncbi:MAG: sigma-54-dependent Fis family transcriptional regulator [Betaproteobacteria bacterium]|nr:sigma-54 dependent transcriptional regulator [Betaproteobacteria bacterium]MDE2002803.1 sigma-54-dependent Fis family transcriptional regulator [Betaproteobacteria bacterium]MDE2209237.1 sigma-54-dependent Fis family transcriptional regulator [Betaproteobacteria bacterium]MDE2358944.1 sigma-54-dependent Fis family transcriptional regulator [Betaproteobacteria bacterium]
MSRRTRGQPRVLVVDDEPDLLELLELTLSRMGLDTIRAESVGEAQRLLDSGPFDLCLTDWNLPDGEGLRVVEHITQKALDVPVAVITAFGSAENAVAALKAGAFDYLAKPVALEQLRALVKQALKVPEKPQPGNNYQLLGDSPAMQQVRGMIDRLARSQAPVYINGESGSGKELAARMIHLKGPRAELPFIAVNCGAIPENLMESEFFGYKKGAFTGAETDRDGFFHAANGGTLFLDEVADLPLAMQVKLLRAIQEKKVRKVGSTGEEPVDTRIISATHKNLSALVDSGDFRQDLYYRLHVIELSMPSLRDMREDIPLIADAILTRLARGSAAALEAEAVVALERYPFPGNVRELENILERGLSLAADPQRITAEDLHLTPVAEETDAPVPAGEKWPLQDYLDRVERAAINEALEKTRYNRTAAAKLLGITFRAMRYRMERLGIK